MYSQHWDIPGYPWYPGILCTHRARGRDIWSASVRTSQDMNQVYEKRGFLELLGTGCGSTGHVLSTESLVSSSTSSDMSVAQKSGDESSKAVVAWMQ